MTPIASPAAGPIYYAVLTTALAGFGLFYDLTAPPGPSRTEAVRHLEYLARAEHVAQAAESNTVDESNAKNSANKSARASHPWRASQRKPS